MLGIKSKDVAWMTKAGLIVVLVAIIFSLMFLARKADSSVADVDVGVEFVGDLSTTVEDLALAANFDLAVIDTDEDGVPECVTGIPEEYLHLGCESTEQDEDYDNDGQIDDEDFDDDNDGLVDEVDDNDRRPDLEIDT